MLDSLKLNYNQFFNKNKIKISVKGLALSNESVRITERYDYRNKIKFVTKVFKFENGKWNYLMIKEEIINQ